MLNKNYSTAAIIMAANVLDGGKPFVDVPEQYKADVTALTGISAPVPASTPAIDKPLTVEA